MKPDLPTAGTRRYFFKFSMTFPNRARVSVHMYALPSFLSFSRLTSPCRAIPDVPSGCTIFKLLNAQPRIQPSRLCDPSMAWLVHSPGLLTSRRCAQRNMAPFLILVIYLVFDDNATMSATFYATFYTRHVCFLPSYLLTFLPSTPPPLPTLHMLTDRLPMQTSGRPVAFYPRQINRNYRKLNPKVATLPTIDNIPLPVLGWTHGGAG